MADLPPQSVNQPADQQSAGHEETTWGEDWESAFQAEDDVFFSDGKEEDFFLEENEPPAKVEAAAQGLDSSQGEAIPGIPAQGAASVASPAKNIAAVLAAFFLSGRIAAQKQFSRLQSFPIFVRIPLYALPFVLTGILFVLNGTPEPAAPAIPQTADSPRTPQADDAATVSPGEAANAADSQHSEQASQLHPEKVRKKWAFPAFIIPVNNPGNDQPTTFVLVDITLVASLDDQEDPPAEKKIFVRDIIYQFFQNKPVEDLRRFSLARGEMNKELRTWLKKQWPEAPIESIIFNQYHLS